MRIVALHAIRSGEWLIVMRLLQGFVFRVMAIDAQGRRRLREMEIKLDLPRLSGFVGHVTGVAAHVQRCVPAAFFRDVHSCGVAGQAKVIFLIARGSFQQLILVIGFVRIVALQAIANRGLVDRTFYICGILVRVTGETERRWSRGN